MIIFQGNRGKVVRLDDPAAQASIGFVGLNQPISYTATRSIITRLTIGQQANVQFLHTLGSHIYIYVFGDRIGQLGLSGISFNAPCEYGAGDSGVAPSDIGIVKMLGWYKANRVSETGVPIRVTVGNLVLEVFVTAATFDTIEPESGLVQWGLNGHTLPDYVAPPPLLQQGIVNPALITTPPLVQGIVNPATAHQSSTLNLPLLQGITS